MPSSLIHAAPAGASRLLAGSKGALYAWELALQGRRRHAGEAARPLESAPGALEESLAARSLEDKSDAGIDAVKPAEQPLVGGIDAAEIEVDRIGRTEGVEESHGAVADAQLDAFDRVPPGVQIALQLRDDRVLASA